MVDVQSSSHYNSIPLPFNASFFTCRSVYRTLRSPVNQTYRVDVLEEEPIRIS